MSDKKNNLIHFVEVAKEKGRELKPVHNPAVEERELVGPEDDPIVRLTMALLETLGDQPNKKPMLVLSAMILVNATLSIQYIRRFGLEAALDMQRAASETSKRYKAVFKSSQTEAQHGPDNDPVETAPKDEP